MLRKSNFTELSSSGQSSCQDGHARTSKPRVVPYYPPKLQRTNNRLLDSCCLNSQQSLHSRRSLDHRQINNLNTFSSKLMGSAVSESCEMGRNLNDYPQQYRQSGLVDTYEIQKLNLKISSSDEHPTYCPQLGNPEKIKEMSEASQTGQSHEAITYMPLIAYGQLLEEDKSQKKRVPPSQECCGLFLFSDRSDFF